MKPSQAQDLMEKVQSLKHMLTARATGGGSATDGDFAQVRVALISDGRTKDRVPDFVRTCRTLDEFWGFIKPKFATYQERREYIRQQFDQVLTHLEATDKSPADDALTQGLKQAAAEHVHAAWEKALARRTDDPDGAITAARTLLETVCKHLLEELGETVDDKADLPKLYGTVASRLKLAPSQQTEQIFKQILGGCHAVVEGLGALRNRLSDAHGKGRAGVTPKPRHAQLAVNLAGSLAMFLIETRRARVHGQPDAGEGQQ